jgi:hypothetical protein
VSKKSLPTKSVYIYATSSCIQIVYFILVNTTKCHLKFIPLCLTTLEVVNITYQCTDTITVNPPKQPQQHYRTQMQKQTSSYAPPSQVVTQPNKKCCQDPDPPILLPPIQDTTPCYPYALPREQSGPWNETKQRWDQKDTQTRRTSIHQKELDATAHTTMIRLNTPLRPNSEERTWPPPTGNGGYHGYLAFHQQRKLQLTIIYIVALRKQKKIHDKDKLGTRSARAIVIDWLSPREDANRLKKHSQQKQIIRYYEPPSPPLQVPIAPVKARPLSHYSVPVPPQHKPAKSSALSPQDVPRLSTDPTHHILQRHLVSCRIRDPIHHYDLLLGQKIVVAPTYHLDVSTGPTKHFPSYQSLQLLQIFGCEQYTTKFGLCSQLFHKNQHEVKEHPSQKVQLNKQLLKVSETGKYPTALGQRKMEDTNISTTKAKED